MSETASQGVIVKGIGGFYYARDDQGTVHVLRARGIFRKRRITPLVGDIVLFSPSPDEEQGWIDDILPRRNQLIRPPVANIQHLIFVLASAPQPDWLLLDTMLIMAREQNITPTIVINKCDLDSSLAQLVREEYSLADVRILEASALQGIGISELADTLRSGICCFAGQSGVGKSSLLSTVTGLSLQSGEISKKIARGKNTTRHAELLIHNGFQVLDTAGFSLLDLWDRMEPVHLQDYYPEITAYQGQCRFQPCYHQTEPGCAVLAAVEDGTLAKSRIERYHQLLEKVKETWRNRYV